MSNQQDKIKNLETKIDTLSNYLNYCKEQITGLKQELDSLKDPSLVSAVKPTPVIVNDPVIEKQPVAAATTTTEPVPQPITPVQAAPTPKKKLDLEEYIGGNLIAKIGIVILVIGVAFGIKYAVDAGLLNPLTRIVMAFALGGGLLFTAFKLKKNYELFSAILLSGAMATLYLTTYAGFAWYDLYPRMAAFVLMLVFTAFTIFAATMYNNQWIAIFGLVGAYCVPFLTSNNSGNIAMFFGYVAIINVGIIILSFKRYWIWLNHLAFVLTIAIFTSWYGAKYVQEKHFGIAIIYSTIYFITFYISFLAYKVLRKEKFTWRDVLLVFINNVFYFSIGLSLIEPISKGAFMGIFAVANAALHFAIGYYLYKKTEVDRNIFYLLLSFVLAFFTIAVPLQLNGLWVSMFWSSEIILLSYIGYTKQIQLYKWFAFGMLFMGLSSIIDDWSLAYSYPYYAKLPNAALIPFFNFTFLSSTIYALAVGTFIYFNRKEKQKELPSYKLYNAFLYTSVPLLVIFSYIAIYTEISDKFYVWYAQSEIKVPIDIGFGQTTFETMNDSSILHFSTSWLFNFTYLFIAVISFINLKKLKNKVFFWINLFLIVLCFFFVIGPDADNLSWLRRMYLNPDNDDFIFTQWHLGIRFISYLFWATGIYMLWAYSKSEMSTGKMLNNILKASIAVYILVILSIEISALAYISEHKSAYGETTLLRRFGYTILWGVYSMALVAFGIYKKNKVLRITAICIFGITLIKLFVIDIQTLSTGFKIVAFLALGALLLTVSFLYQKFAKILFANDDNNNNA